ncbi:MAG: hypothetical protein CVU57_14620 [Deltaproteobacteria bacterium HGW-Deltaproteobacteria-15]|nr:MAG: hypothetical protein CVU57_14620 [Deltaproteobacteria bacterium HGW-Deltaproteobacteria-15]
MENKVTSLLQEILKSQYAGRPAGALEAQSRAPERGFLKKTHLLTTPAPGGIISRGRGIAEM